MVFDGFEWKFRGPRAQEIQVHDIAYSVDTVDIPCGKCELCRVDARYSKALRIMLEAESWPEATYFITLTYREEDLGSPELVHADWAQFIKNFRRRYCEAQFCKIADRATKRHGKVYSKTFKKIKQVMCGEYGDTFGRKHFHGILFNHSFDDVVFTGEYSKKGNPLHTSPSLEETWGKGRVQLERVNFDLALYVGSYVTDPIDDEPDRDHKKKQYGRFGRGIGLSWIEKYWRDALSAGRIITSQGEYPIPRYFQKKIKEMHPEEFEKFRSANILRLQALKAKTIPKGDGPLRRAKAKGRIFNHKFNKRKLDENRVDQVGGKPTERKSVLLQGREVRELRPSDDGGKPRDVHSQAAGGTPKGPSDLGPPSA